MNEKRLYNVLFPVWLFYIYPTWAWLIILSANFAVDSFVLYVAMRRREIEGKREVWKRSILRLWGIGFFADMIGAALILGLYFLIDALELQWDTTFFPGVTLIAVPGVILAACLIYALDRRYGFAKCGLNYEDVRKLSLAMAVFTAPYAMLIPLYG